MRWFEFEGGLFQFCFFLSKSGLLVGLDRSTCRRLVTWVARQSAYRDVLFP